MSGTYAEGAGDACAAPTGTPNEELPISLKTPRLPRTTPNRRSPLRDRKFRSFSGGKSGDSPARKRVWPG